MKKKHRIGIPDQAGWGCFGVLLLVLAPLCIYFVLTSTYDTVNPLVRVFAAFFAAALGAGVVTAVVNSILQWRAQGRQASEREAAPVAKKSKRKK